MTDAYPKEANIFNGLVDEGWVPLRLMRATKPDAIAALKVRGRGVCCYDFPLLPVTSYYSQCLPSTRVRMLQTYGAVCSRRLPLCSAVSLGLPLCTTRPSLLFNHHPKAQVLP